MKILVTGGCGFIGANFVRAHLRDYPDDTVANLDALTYAGNPANLADVAHQPNYLFVHGSITDRNLVHDLLGATNAFDAIVNFAAESHVDRSIDDPQTFVETNIVGTQILLQAARKHRVPRFVQVSTDEVYGSLGPEGRFTETTPVAPRSPYSASKASADHIALAYYHTYQLPVLITRCSNNYGPYQFPEKLIPLMIINALQNKELPVYGDGLYVRDWLHVADHCQAIETVLRDGNPGEVYNVGGNNEIANLDLVRMLLKALGKPESLIRHVADRPGHDRRYAIDSSRIQTELGWTPRMSFTEGLPATIQWYLDNRPWWEKIISGEYRKYYDQMYGNR